MSHETWDAQAAAYALGALDGEELAEFERHLAEGCGQCEFALVQSAEALALVAAGLPAAPPPAAVRDALVRRLAAEHGLRLRAQSRGLTAIPGGGTARSERAGARHELAAPAASPGRIGRDPRDELRRTWWRWSAGAAAALIVGAFLAWGFTTMHYEAQLGQKTRQAIAQRDQLRAEIAALQTRAAAYQEVVELLRDPGARVVALQGTGSARGARARVVWHERTGGRLLVDNLPKAPEGKAYEAWTISGGKPRPAGVFQVDASGDAVHRLPPAAGPVEVFAISLEPAAGVPAPTGPIVLASTR